MRKTICCALAMIMITGCMTGCGGNSKSGESGIEEAGKAYMTALVYTDVDGYIKLIPEEVVEYLEDEYYVTEDQFAAVAEAHLEEWVSRFSDESIKEIRNEIKKAVIEDEAEFEIDEIQELNEYLYVVKAEEAYWLDFDCDFECCVFKCNDRWYSFDAIEEMMEQLA